MHRDILIVHAGYRKSREPGPFLPGPQFSSMHTAPGDPSQHGLTYERFHNPTWTSWEDALGVLEGGQATAFASGMAAVAAVFGVSLRRGDVVVLPADSYYAIRKIASTWLDSIGVQVRLAPTKGNAQAAALDRGTAVMDRIADEPDARRLRHSGARRGGAGARAPSWPLTTRRRPRISSSRWRLGPPL